ncbi:7-cyano-7-deazaguanine synthase QueC [Desulfuromonas sp. AOP6]|uniref:7-cyano-7-deazaguanine synthase QueC n=1 Tax=Desulfuromonas sp. AOP6 TaxID=1566351 RepID=UPI00126BE081|nr:7-cyano-7-deazaguanine synthase QueC [Desulfuromonas sp. AOP6]BCA78227.1 7-cyano-7-deazaguanine synthase [Desulfuromonas sp. AOP6]
MKKKAVVLYSGGLDSTTCMAIAQAEGFVPYAMSFAYGQRHSVEVSKAMEYAKEIGAKDHHLVEFDLRRIGGSALTSDLEVPKEGVEEGNIPVTYVPARNTIFLSFALGWAEVLGAFDIYIGVNALDYSGYPDCRPEYIAAFETLANLATREGVEGRGRYRIHTPLMTLTKGEIIRRGLQLGVNYALTHSCYDPSPEGLSCGICDSCRLRLKGFAEVGVADPIPYAGRTDKR